MTESTKTEQDEVMDRKHGARSASLPTLAIDWELYGRYLEESDMSDDEKREFIAVLWSIVVSFVDLGLGIHPAQLATRRDGRDDDAPLDPGEGLPALPSPTARDDFVASVVRSAVRDFDKESA